MLSQCGRYYFPSGEPTRRIIKFLRWGTDGAGGGGGGKERWLMRCQPFETRPKLTNLSSELLKNRFDMVEVEADGEESDPA